MKKIVLSFVVLVMAFAFFSGCSKMDGAYSVGKTVYQGGKVLATKAIENDMVSEETAGKLKMLDKGASAYDEARTVVRGQVDEKKPDVNTSASIE